MECTHFLSLLSVLAVICFHGSTAALNSAGNPCIPAKSGWTYFARYYSGLPACDNEDNPIVDIAPQPNFPNQPMNDVSVNEYMSAIINAKRARMNNNCTPGETLADCRTYYWDKRETGNFKQKKCSNNCYFDIEQLKCVAEKPSWCMDIGKEPGTCYTSNDIEGGSVLGDCKQYYRFTSTCSKLRLKCRGLTYYDKDLGECAFMSGENCYF